MPKAQHRVRTTGLELKLREIADEPERVADVKQESKSIRADGTVVGHHEYVLEEAIDRLAELRRCLERRHRVSAFERLADGGAGALDPARELDLGRLEQQVGIQRRAGVSLGAAREPVGTRVGGVQP